MNFFKGLYIGFASYYKAAIFIYEKKLWKYFVFPMLLMLLFWQVGNWLKSTIKSDEFLVYENLNDLMHHLIYLLWLTSLSILAVEFKKYLVVGSLAPVISNLSQKVETEITGEKYPFIWKQWITDLKRGFRIIFRNLGIEYLFFLAFLIGAAFYSPFEPFVKPLTVFIGCYFYGFSFIDYLNERRRLSISESVLFVRQHKGLAVSIGAIYSLLFWVEGIGIVIGPIWAIVAATLAMEEVVGLPTSVEKEEEK